MFYHHPSFPRALDGNHEPTRLTVELGRIVEEGVNVWDFDYPSYYTGADKTAFEQKVIDHYYFRQIGQETVGRFLHMFRARIREIMPYYIQLYESVAMMDDIDDIFGNVDMTEEYTRTKDTTSSGSSSGTSSGTVKDNDSRQSHGERLHSDTPQGSIQNLDNHLTDATRENSTDVITNSREDDAQTSTTTEGTGKETETFQHTRKGNQGVNTYAHDMREYREILINVDMQIIENLNDLFLGVY